MDVMSCFYDMNELDLEIISPEKKVYTGKVKSATIPGTKGNFQVLYNHAPLISTFDIGIIKLVLSDDSTQIFTTSGGSTEVLDNKVLILSDTVEPIEKKKEGIVDVDRARVALARALNRIKMSEKYSKD